MTNVPGTQAVRQPEAPESSEKQGNMMKRYVLAGLAALLFGNTALAQQSEDTLRVSFRNPLESTDYFFTTLRESVILQHHLYDHLLIRDPKTLELVPGLAEAYRWVDDRTLEFDIRQNVKFHDGSMLAAEDVAHTINSVIAPGVTPGVPSNYTWIESAEVTGPYQVRVRTKGIFPAALEYLANTMPIYPRTYKGKSQDAPHAIGTGPYRLVSQDASEYVLERFEDHYAASPKGRPAIKTLKIRIVPDAATDIAELLSGGLDLIWNVASDQIDGIRRLPDFEVTQAESMRITYLSMDAAGRSDKNSPLTKVEVRRAISHAIDKRTLVENLLPGASVIDTPCYPKQFGCSPEVARYPYDPARAKQLLAEAGYPNGVAIDFYWPTYRPRIWGEVIQSNLQQVGIDANMILVPVAQMQERARNNEIGFFYLDHGSYSINDASVLYSWFFAGGADDFARDPELQSLIGQSQATTDTDTRREIMYQVSKRAADQAYILPMSTFSTTYAASKSVKFDAFVDEIPRFYLYQWN